MLEPAEALSERDLERIAALHVASIDDSVPALVGGRFVVAFYRFVAASPHEWVLFERLEGEIVSVCVVSDDPASVYARTVRATFWTLLSQCVVALLTRPAFRALLRTYLAERLRGGVEPMQGPEIAFLFTDSGHRGEGLGQRMIERVDAFFRGRGSPHYWVQTIDSPSNQTIPFYDRNGFRRAGWRRERGQRFLVFQKSLEADRAEVPAEVRAP